MKLRAMWVFALGLLLGWVGCSTTQKYTTESASNLDPRRYQTYELRPFLGEPTRQSGHEELVGTLRPLVRQEVQQVMVAKGYALADSAQSADLVIVISGKLTPKSIVLVEADRLQRSMGTRSPTSDSLGRNQPGVIHRNDFNKGHLQVGVYERATGRMVWVSWFDRDVQQLERLDANRIAGNVGLMLQEFPGR